jgi:NitT/TauT family transport system permease protein
VGESLSRIFEGFVISMLAGTAFGVLMGLKRDVEIFFDSWIMVLLTVPAVCWAFLSVLWFGISQVAPILTIVLIVFPFVVMNVWEGTKALEKDLMEMASVYRADRALMLRKVLIPQLMPYLFSSLRIALSLSWKIALVAEAFGAGSGVGQELMNQFQDTRVDMMLAWGVSFMIVMVLIDLLVFRPWARRAFAWRQQFAT